MHASPKTERARSAEVHGVVQRCFRHWPEQKSEEPIVALKPGNAGGAKGLWFGARLNEADERGLA